ncbi:MAG: tetratricopeptide repeat protein [Vicinamibacterales bacterium]
MKAKERQHLKQNEFADTALRVVAAATENRQRVVTLAVVAGLVIALVAGYAWWRRHTAEQGGSLLGEAMATVQAPIVPAPTLPGATQTPGTYPTAEARNEAALEKFRAVMAQYPFTAAGRSATYHAAALLLSTGKAAEAETLFAQNATEAASTIYGPMSRMGEAEAQAAQGKYDQAIATFTALSADRDGPVPVDGVLMQLARVQLEAGHADEAKAAFKRVVDEFPESVYLNEARQELTKLG